uniref:Uncharacterized protein n=1 Tax=Avena sativa TaxID=4498 RepID=A0ACD5Z3L5_AVESA
MDSETSTRHDVDLLERVLLDRNAEPTNISLSLLEDITNSFSDDHQIGSGGFAVVYKGIVGKGVVAVKKLSKTFGLHEDKFHKEVECLMKAKHKNIVRFVGYCSDAQGRIADNKGKFVMADIRNLLLCFEYVPNGSLDKYITDASCGLEWRERYGIIKGMCEGLLHLHEKHILHLDLKPSNILVDDQMIPKITDFGLSRCLDKEQTRDITSKLYGSLGYLAPEFFFSGEVAFASDIYSLGVIIVEILTGKKGYPEDENVVENWMNRLEGSDQRDTQLEQIRVCIKIGIECMDLDPKKRPVAHHIIDRLDKTASTIETGISGSSVEQKVSFLKDQYFQGESAKLSPEYLRKDIGEQAETEQQGQEDALGDQWSLWEAEYAKQNGTPEVAIISSTNSGLLNRLNNLDIFNKKAQRNYIKYCGPMLEKALFVKLFKMGEFKSILKDEYLLRKDDFGEVYKGMMGNCMVTVRKPSDGNMLNGKGFAHEVIIQSKIIRRNIVRILGCCLESDVPMLVYEYFSKVCLDDVLHSKDKVPLDLGMRLIIAAESARGLAYMHSHAYTTILHGNFTPGNVLLDEDYWPKISDFGISRMAGKYYEHTQRIIGDIAYMDPVYLQTGCLTEQSDVYSFGVVILELLTRKKATHADNNSMVRKFLENHWQGRKSTELFDEEIAVTEDLDLLHCLAEIAVKCLNFDVDLRPTMTEVAERLSVLSKPHEQWFTN